MDQAESVIEPLIDGAPKLIVLGRRLFAARLISAGLLAVIGAYLVSLPQWYWQTCGWFFVAVFVVSLCANGPSIWNPLRFACIRVGEQGLEGRIGFRKLAADYLSAGSFRLVRYFGGDCLVWRDRAHEEMLDPAEAAIPPDPLDDMSRCIQLPGFAFAPGDSLAEIAAAANQQRKAAMARAGVKEIRGVVPLESAAQPVAARQPFLRPPAIGRLAFALLFFLSMPLYFVLAFLAFGPIRDAIGAVLLWVSSAEPADLDRPSFAAKLITYALLIAGYFVVVSWLTFGRLRDIDRRAGWSSAFSQAFDLFLSGSFSRATAMTRLLLRRGQ